jgi:hypothetical protein
VNLVGLGRGEVTMTSRARFRICERVLNYIGRRSSPFRFNTTVNVRSADIRTMAKTTSVL